MKVTLPEFERAGVLVVGDVMLDRYWYGPTLSLIHISTSSFFSFWFSSFSALMTVSLPATFFCMSAVR